MLRILVVVVGMMFCTSCRWGDDLCFAFCSECQIKTEDCTCVNDTKYDCPAGTVHGHYNYDLTFIFPSCRCICDPGWMGARCDQRDTSYYIRFRHGSDTLSLSEMVTTSEIDQVDSSLLKFYFPADSIIDTIKLWSPLVRIEFSADIFEQQGYVMTPICTTDPACYRMEVVFKNSETAIAQTGAITLDTTFKATFSANLTISGTSQNFYMRQGAIRLYSFF